MYLNNIQPSDLGFFKTQSQGLLAVATFHGIAALINRALPMGFSTYPFAKVNTILLAVEIVELASHNYMWIGTDLQNWEITLATVEVVFLAQILYFGYNFARAVKTQAH